MLYGASVSLNFTEFRFTNISQKTIRVVSEQTQEQLILSTFICDMFVLR